MNRFAATTARKSSFAQAADRLRPLDDQCPGKRYLDGTGQIQMGGQGRWHVEIAQPLLALLFISLNGCLRRKAYSYACEYYGVL